MNVGLGRCVQWGLPIFKFRPVRSVTHSHLCLCPRFTSSPLREPYFLLQSILLDAGAQLNSLLKGILCHTLARSRRKVLISFTLLSGVERFNLFFTFFILSFSSFPTTARAAICNMVWIFLKLLTDGKRLLRELMITEMTRGVCVCVCTCVCVHGRGGVRV